MCTLLIALVAPWTDSFPLSLIIFLLHIAATPFYTRLPLLRRLLLFLMHALSPRTHTLDFCCPYTHYPERLARRRLPNRRGGALRRPFDKVLMAHGHAAAAPLAC